MRLYEYVQRLQAFELNGYNISITILLHIRTDTVYTQEHLGMSMQIACNVKLPAKLFRSLLHLDEDPVEVSLP